MYGNCRFDFQHVSYIIFIFVGFLCCMCCEMHILLFYVFQNIFHRKYLKVLNIEKIPSFLTGFELVDINGFEPLTFRTSSGCSSS